MNTLHPLIRHRLAELRSLHSFEITSGLRFDDGCLMQLLACKGCGLKLWQPVEHVKSKNDRAAFDAFAPLAFGDPPVDFDKGDTQGQEKSPEEQNPEEPPLPSSVTEMFNQLEAALDVDPSGEALRKKLQRRLKGFPDALLEKVPVLREFLRSGGGEVSVKDVVREELDGDFDWRADTDWVNTKSTVFDSNSKPLAVGAEVVVPLEAATQGSVLTVMGVQHLVADPEHIRIICESDYPSVGIASDYRPDVGWASPVYVV